MLAVAHTNTFAAIIAPSLVAEWLNRWRWDLAPRQVAASGVIVGACEGPLSRTNGVSSLSDLGQNPTCSEFPHKYG